MAKDTGFMPVGDAFAQYAPPAAGGTASQPLIFGRQGSGRGFLERLKLAVARTFLSTLALALALAAGIATLSPRVEAERGIHEQAAATPMLTVVSLSAPGDAGDTEGHATLETEDGFVFAVTDVDPATWAGLHPGQEAKNSRYGVPYTPSASTLLPGIVLAIGVFGAAFSVGNLLLFRRKAGAS